MFPFCFRKKKRGRLEKLVAGIIIGGAIGSIIGKKTLEEKEREDEDEETTDEE